MTNLKQKQLLIYSRKNPGVFTAYDSVGIDCGCTDQDTGGIVYVARGGCLVIECLRCNTLWRFNGLQTAEHGPPISATENPNAFE